MSQTALPQRPNCLVSTGSILIDLPLKVARFPKAGSAVTALSNGAKVGGGYTIARATASQQVPVALASTLGTGPNSALVRASMLRDGVENVVQELVGDIGTCTTLIEPGGQRTFITTEGVESEPQLEDLEKLELVPGDYVHAAGYDLVHRRTREGISQWLSALPTGVQLVVDFGPAVVDIVDQILLKIMARADIITGNRREIDQLRSRLGGVDLMYRAAPNAMFVRRIGSAGCELLLPDHGQDTLVSGYPMSVTDTTGAGDTHTGVLIASLLQGYSVLQSARRANAAAALMISKREDNHAPTAEDINQLLREAGDVESLAAI